MPARSPKKKTGLYANIQAKRQRIEAGSGETMRKPHSEGAPTDDAFRKAARTAKGGGRRHLSRRRAKPRARRR